jgi:simple sugar transport system substrate-binding protein
MLRRFFTWTALLGLPLAAVGCSGPVSGEPDAGRPLKVGFIYIGARDDYGYNQAHALGAAAVKQMKGVVVTEEEMVPDTADVQKTMRSMIEIDGAGVIFPTSFGYFDPHILKLAGECPRVKFLHCGGLFDAKIHPSNLGTYFGFIDECQYVSGIVAAYATKSKKLGFVAGKAIPQVRRNINAFALGARSIDPEITCSVVFTGDWSLPIKEAEATNSLIDQGVDVMTCHVNSPKVVVETSERRGIKTCGYHCNQATLAPKGYLTGAEWNWAKVYTDYVAAVQAGRPITGMVRGGLKEQMVKMSPYTALVGPEARQAADAAQQKFLSGGFTAFAGPLSDNAGNIVIAKGVRHVQTAIELETMNYLVEGVIGK